MALYAFMGNNCSSNICKYTYSEAPRNKLKVWSYTDDRAPPGKMRAHSDPNVSSATGCKYWARVAAFVASIEAIKKNLGRKFREKRHFFHYQSFTMFTRDL